MNKRPSHVENWQMRESQMITAAEEKKPEKLNAPDYEACFDPDETSVEEISKFVAQFLEAAQEKDRKVRLLAYIV